MNYTDVRLNHYLAGKVSTQKVKGFIYGALPFSL